MASIDYRQAHDAPHHVDDSPPLLIACGWIGLLGTAALGISNVVGSIVVPGHDWIADTISDLGAGRYEIIQDLGLYGYAAALLACAIGAANRHIGGARWSWAILGLALLALMVTLVGVRNEYGDGDSDGIVMHRYFVYGLGVLFAAVPMLMARGMGARGKGWAVLAWTCGVLWAVAAPVFFFLPTGIDGIYERGLGVITMVFVGGLSLLLLREGREMRQGG